MYLGGEDVTDAIRRPVISQYTSGVSAIPAVRAFLERQQDLARTHDVIMDGQDISTVVLPARRREDFSTTASARDRARRRYAELAAKQGQSRTL